MIEEIREAMTAASKSSSSSTESSAPTLNITAAISFTSFDFSAEQAAKATEILQQMTASFAQAPSVQVPQPDVLDVSATAQASESNDSSPISAPTPRRGRWSVRPSLGASEDSSFGLRSARPSLMVATADSGLVAPEQVPIAIAPVNDDSDETQSSSSSDTMTEVTVEAAASATASSFSSSGATPHRRRWSMRPSTGAARPSLLDAAMLMSPAGAVQASQTAPITATSAMTAFTADKVTAPTESVSSSSVEMAAQSDVVESKSIAPAMASAFSVRQLCFVTVKLSCFLNHNVLLF